MKRATLEGLKQEDLDLLIIGGGVTGCATARDAAQRGLKVALVEKNDFAYGTSSRSTKLVHGGLRYLENLEFKLVSEAVREREILTRTAPHLVRPFQFLYPVYRGDDPGILKLRVGLWLYDRYAGTPKGRRTRILNREQVIQEEPHLRREELVGGGIFFDAQTDDARLTLEFAISAAEEGARIMNYARVEAFTYDGKGRIDGVRLHDLLSGETKEVKARQVVNAGGVWVDRVRHLDERDQGRKLRPTKGVHIVFKQEDVPLQHAIYVRHPRDHRAVFGIPRGEIVYVGTTDTDFDGSPDEVFPNREDVEYLVEVTNHAVPGRSLTVRHVQAAWAGLRPLIKPDDDEKNPSAVSREHQIFLSAAGLLTIAGGKLTTSRAMGAQVVDRVVELLRKEGGVRDLRQTRTAEQPLPGGNYHGSLHEIARSLEQQYDLEPAVAERLADRYGSRALNIARLTRQDPSLKKTFAGEVGPVTKAEVRYAVEEEMARTLTDFLDRRTGFLPLTRDAGLSIAEPVAAFMGELLGWSEEERKKQVEEYRRLVERTRAFREGGREAGAAAD